MTFYARNWVNYELFFVPLQPVLINRLIEDT